jgi:RNA polymerase sigma factor (sigma-70 family)
VGQSRRNQRFGRVAGVLLRTLPDDRLIALARDGGPVAFEEIVRRHGPALTAYAAVLAPPSRAEDVVQESLLKAYSALQDGAQPEVVRAWLFRIVRNTAIDEHRGVRHHEQLDPNYDGVEQPPQALDRREELAALVAAIRDLPAAQREAIVQRELEGRGHEDIARALDVSPGAVRQLIYRARNGLREGAGALIPGALLRAASLPGADSAVGGLGMAGALKVGVAAVVATGTIVAGASFERHDGGGRAEALPIPKPRLGVADRGVSSVPASDPDSSAHGRDPGKGQGRPAPTADRGRSPAQTPSSPADGGGSDHSGSGGGTSGNSGPGSDDSGSEDHSGPGSGSGSGSGEMEGSGGTGGEGGSSGEGSGGGSSGPGGQTEDHVSGGGSGEDDGTPSGLSTSGDGRD